DTSRKGTGRSHTHGLVPGARDLEEYLLLPLEQDLAVVDPPRGIHVTIGFDQLIAGKAFVGLTGFLDLALGYCGFGISLCGRHPTPLDASVRAMEHCKSGRGTGEAANSIQPLRHGAISTWSGPRGDGLG